MYPDQDHVQLDVRVLYITTIPSTHVLIMDSLKNKVAGITYYT